MNLFEILRSAGGGDAFRAFSMHYGMTEDDIRRAAEALLPAFSAGLKQSTSDPLGLLAFMQQLAVSDFLRAYANPNVFLGLDRADADRALEMLFGSAVAAEAILQQASAFSGLSTAKLRELMAPLAAVMLGGLAAHARTANPLLDAMLKQFGAPASGAAPKGPLDRLEEEQAGREREASAMAKLQLLQTQLMESGLAAFQAGTAAWQRAMRDLAEGNAPAGGSGEPGIRVSGRDLFGEMFDAGVRLSEAYRREMEALVERMRPPAPEK